MLLLQFQIGRVDEDATAVKMLTSQLFKREMDQQIISDGRDILGYVRGMYLAAHSTLMNAWPAQPNGEWDLLFVFLLFLSMFVFLLFLSPSVVVVVWSLILAQLHPNPSDLGS